MRATLAGLVVGATIAAVGAAAITACGPRNQYTQRRLTGSCSGACDHYLACKRADDATAHGACLAECREVFADEDSLRAFESLSCPLAIEYVEGTSGRGPGRLIGAPATGGRPPSSTP